MVTVAAHQSVASWLKCVFKPLFPLLSSMVQRNAHKDQRQVFISLWMFWKLIISHQIINMPEGKKEHSKVRCLNQGGGSLFTCIHNYRKLVLNPSKLKRFFICSDYRVKRGYGRDLRRAAPEEEGEQLRELLADKEQQVSRAMRSRQTQTVAHVKTLTLTLALLSPTGATLKEAGALRALRSSWLKSRKSLLKSCFDKKN